MKRVGWVALIGAFALLAAGCNVNWAQFRDGPSHSGTQSESVIGTANVAALLPKWTTGVGGGVSTSPAIVDGVAYVVTSDGYAFALDARTGAIKWFRPPSASSQDSYSSPAVANGIVYVGRDDHTVVALDATTGATEWSVTTGGMVESSPTVVSGVVYVGSQDHKVYALDATTGAVKWTTTTGDGVDSSPAVVNGVVYVGSWDGKLYALDAHTGAVKWSTTTGAGILSSPSVANGIVYVGSHDDKLYALDATTGAVKWTTTTGGVVESSPAVANGVVYVGSDDHKVYAFDATTGVVKWTATTVNNVESSPAVANGVVYVGSRDGRLWAFDAATGTAKWADNTLGGVHSSPSVANGIVYVGSDHGTVTAYAPSKTTPTCAVNPYIGLSPCQIQDAYRLPAQVAGAGRTVAIVDAFDDPQAEADLAVYRAQYGLPACTTANGCFKKLNQTGATSPLPVGDTHWSEEISLDLDAVSAACPLCHITLVEADDNSGTNLLAAEATAGAQSPTAISNSWGGGEFAGESTLDHYFSFPGIPVTVSTGDDGYGIQWPSSSASVTAVGGTELVADGSARRWSETAWAGAGSGCSAQEPKPAWQTDAGCANRTVADVSALAGSPGLSVYDTYGESGWIQLEGTSLASPLIAAVYAMAYPDYTQATTYTHAASVFDITSGSTGSCGGSYLCNAGVGFDGPTGLGTPCGTAAFGSGPFATACPPPAPSDSPLATTSNPPEDLTPSCGAVPAGFVRCYDEKPAPSTSKRPAHP